MEEILAEHEATREQFRAECLARREERRRELDARYGEIQSALDAGGEVQRRGFASVEAALANDRQQFGLLVDARHALRANTEGLLRILDELRREDGSGTARA